jgi:hypothetical protein
MRKITKKELVKKVYDELLGLKDSGFNPIQFNADGTVDTNRFARLARHEIASRWKVDVGQTTASRYLREFKKSA